MKIYQTIFSLTELSEYFSSGISGNLLFADIKTTGLSSSRNSIYCIGTAQVHGNSGKILQFFAEQADEEPEILKQFSDFFLTDPDRRLITYNGTSFDLPFLKQRFAYWKMPFPLEHTEHIDVYRKIRRLQPLLQLNSMKQKSVELFLNIIREDLCSGKDLIRIYRKYEKTKDPDLLELLKLHNLDDMKGLCALTAIRPYVSLTDGMFTLTHADCIEEQDSLSAGFEITFPDSLISSITRSEPNGPLIALRKHSGIIRFPVMHGTLRLFLNDYKNYFYLPEEHTVIHKSVGQFVDPAHRTAASRENCFLQKEGFFIRISDRLCRKGPKNLFFRESYDSQICFLDISGFWQSGQSVPACDIPSRESDLIHQIILDLLNGCF